MSAWLTSWPSEPATWGALAASLAVYVRGWRVLRRRDPERWRPRQLAFFVGGLAAVALALVSPIEAFAPLLLQAHMVQHVLLLMLAPPLVWLADPLFPCVRGLPRPLRKTVVPALFQSRALRALFERLTHPAAALPVFLGVNLVWHVPAMYEWALGSTAAHYVQHASFLGAALLFWHPVVRPYPARPKWSLWILIPYLLIADVANTALSAVLTFSDRVVYPHYESAPRLWGLTALADQSAAGVIMWVPGAFAFLAPLAVVGVRLFSPSGAHERPRPPAPTPPRRATPPTRRPFDLLRVPAVGALVRLGRFRTGVQALLALLAALVVVDGLTGPQVGAMNLAGVLPWTHWRGLVVLGLLTAGNLFCFACPFTLPRRLAGRRLRADLHWPKRLQSKWIAVGLVALFLWGYEAFSLWDSPWWTAWIALGYFSAAFAVDSCFRGAAFCKYVCPIGQFHFVQSLVSPLEVRARSAGVCGACRTHDCIERAPGGEGCQLKLFVPKKSGNLDCTFCLDCVRACPHDNVGVLAVAPMSQSLADPPRSGVGRLSERADLAALVLVLVFGAFANAGGMVAPVLEARDRFQAALGLESPLLLASAYYLLALVAAPGLAVAGATAASRIAGRMETPPAAVARRFAYSLVPIGFAMWLAHYSFHFFTSWRTALPALQRFAGDLGWTALGPPAWSSACCRPAGDGLLLFEILALDFGLLASLYSAWRIAASLVPQGRSPLAAAAPWGAVVLALFAAGLWIVFQPMEMRGTLNP